MGMFFKLLLMSDKDDSIGYESDSALWVTFKIENGEIDKDGFLIESMTTFRSGYKERNRSTIPAETALFIISVLPPIAFSIETDSGSMTDPRFFVNPVPYWVFDFIPALGNLVVRSPVEKSDKDLVVDLLADIEGNSDQNGGK